MFVLYEATSTYLEPVTSTQPRPLLCSKFRGVTHKPFGQSLVLWNGRHPAGSV